MSLSCSYKSTGKPLHIKYGIYEALCKLLSKSTINLFHSDFSVTIDMAKKGDFIFIDPPYMNVKRSTTKYSTFTQRDHERLIEAILSADKRGCFIMMFNHNHPYLTKKLANFKTIKVDHLTLRKSYSRFASYDEFIYINY